MGRRGSQLLFAMSVAASLFEDKFTFWRIQRILPLAQKIETHYSSTVRNNPSVESGSISKGPTLFSNKTVSVMRNSSTVYYISRTFQDPHWSGDFCRRNVIPSRMGPFIILTNQMSELGLSWGHYLQRNPTSIFTTTSGNLLSSRFPSLNRVGCYNCCWGLFYLMLTNPGQYLQICSDWDPPIAMSDVIRSRSQGRGIWNEPVWC